MCGCYRGGNIKCNDNRDCNVLDVWQQLPVTVTVTAARLENLHRVTRRRGLRHSGQIIVSEHDSDGSTTENSKSGAFWELTRFQQTPRARTRDDPPEKAAADEALYL